MDVSFALKSLQYFQDLNFRRMSPPLQVHRQYQTVRFRSVLESAVNVSFFWGPLSTNARQGGVTVLTDILLEFIQLKNIDVIPINTNKNNKFFQVYYCVGEILLKLLRSPSRSKVLVNLTFRDVYLLLPFRNLKCSIEEPRCVR